MQKLRQVCLLYIEDDEKLAQSIKKHLVKQGYQVSLAQNGEEGIHLLKNNTFDIAVTDYHMPVMNGMTVLKSLAEHDVLPIPIIMVTGRGNEHIAVEAMKLGASDYLTKNENYQERLSRTIEQVLEKKRLIDEKKQIKKALYYRDAILEAVNFAAESFLREINWTQHIDNVLWSLGRAAQVSRVYIAENIHDESGKLYAKRCYEWVAKNISSQLNDSKHNQFCYENIPRWAELLSEGHLIYGLIKDFPTNEQAILTAQSIHSTVVMPVFVGQAWWGFIGFDDCLEEREWSQVEIGALKAAADTLGTAIQHDQAEENLRRERDFSNAILDTTANLIVVLDLQGRIIRVNRACEKLTNYSIAESKNLFFWDLFSPLEEVESIKTALNMLVNQHTPAEYQCICVNKAGEHRLIEWSNSILLNTQGKVDYVIGTGVDVTERNLAELKLRQRIELEELISTLSAHFINLPLEDIENSITEALEKISLFVAVDRSHIILFSEESLQKNNIHEWCAPNIPSIIEELEQLPKSDFTWILNKIRQNEIVQLSQMTMLPAEAEHEKILSKSLNIQSLLIVPMVFAGRAIGFISLEMISSERQWTESDLKHLQLTGEMFSNVLLRKHTEERLLDSKQRHQNIFNTMEVSIWETDFSAIVETLNQLRRAGVVDLKQHLHRNKQLAWSLMHQISINDINATTLRLFEAANKKDFLQAFNNIFALESLDAFIEKLCAIWNGEHSFQSEITCRTLNGQELNLALSMPIPKTAESARQIPISLLDITQRKQVEETLRRNQTRLSEAQRIAHLGYWDWNLNNNAIRWSEETFRIFGLSQKDTVPSFESFKKVLHPSECDHVLHAIQQATHKNTGYELEYRIIRQDGSVRYVHAIGENLCDEEGKPIQVLGTIQDITERKEVEEALRQSEQRAKAAEARLFDAIESISEGFALWDTFDRLVLCNKKYQQFYPKLAEHLKPGVDFEDIVRLELEEGGEKLTGREEQEAWLHIHLQERRVPLKPYEQNLPDGRWLMASERRTSEGGIVCIRTDITKLKQREKALHDKEQILRTVLNATTDAILMIDKSGICLISNPVAAEHLGVPIENLVGHRLYDFLSPNIIERRRQFVETVIKNKKPLFFEEKKQHHWFENAIHPVIDKKGTVNHVSIFSRDITERKQAEEELQRFKDILEASPDFVGMADNNGMLFYLNRSAQEMLRCKEDKTLLDKPLFDYYPQEIADKMRKEAIPTAENKGVWNGETILLGCDQREIPLSQVIISHKSNGNVEYYSTIARDITERKQAEMLIQHQANYDALTDLPNRHLFMDRLEQALRFAQRKKIQLALMFIDLDKFKEVNDSLGHSAGDELLQIVSKRLKSCVRKSDTVARLGGDEFTVILPEVNRIEDAEIVAEKILTVLSQAFRLRGQDIFISASIGIAFFPDEKNTDIDSETLLINADAAMYDVKEKGRDAFQIFSQHSSETKSETLLKNADAAMYEAKEKGRDAFQIFSKSPDKTDDK